VSKKDLMVLGGVCTIVTAVTAASRKKKWEDVHTAATIAGALITMAGAIS